MFEEGDKVVCVRDPVGLGIGEITQMNVFSSSVRFYSGCIYVDNRFLIKAEDFFDLSNPKVWVIDDTLLKDLVNSRGS